jgi:hypothetical protein
MPKRSILENPLPAGTINKGSLMASPFRKYDKLEKVSLRKAQRCRASIVSYAVSFVKLWKNANEEFLNNPARSCSQAQLVLALGSSV